jgi:hypothetical protein
MIKPRFLLLLGAMLVRVIYFITSALVESILRCLCRMILLGEITFVRFSFLCHIRAILFWGIAFV